MRQFALLTAAFVAMACTSDQPVQDAPEAGTGDVVVDNSDTDADIPDVVVHDSQSDDGADDPVDVRDAALDGPPGDLATEDVPEDLEDAGEPARSWPFRVERVELPPLTDRFVRWPEEGELEGFGGALVDFDGDGDTDVFLGNATLDGSPPCLYRNISRPERLRFEPVSLLCGEEWAGLNSGAAVDLEGDGFEELLLVGDDDARLVRFEPSFAVEDLYAELEEVDCYGGAIAGYDEDFDGVPEIVIACQPGHQRNYRASGNLVLRRGDDGAWRLVESGLRVEGLTLALGFTDIDGDGLLDVALVNDTTSRAGLFNPLLHPGGIFARCAPDEDCAYRTWSFGVGFGAYGALMGFGMLQHEALGPVAYLTDWGPNRAIQFAEDGTATNYAETLGLEFGDSVFGPLVNWGAWVDDFDKNGTEDLLVTQGHLGLTSGRIRDHAERLALQAPDGTFTVSTDAGFSPHDTATDRYRFEHIAPRGVVAIDFDRDGELEFIMGALEGHPLVYQERADPEAPPRCTVIPRPRYVVTNGYGYGFTPLGGRERYRHVQGEFRFGAASALVITEGRGMLRFPSGFTMSFDCEGTAGPIELVEPAWWDGERIDATVWPSPPPVTRIASRDAAGEVTVGTERAADATAVMLELDHRWSPRWFDVATGR